MLQVPGAPAEGLQPGAVVAGRYRIEEELASGGMGRVYLARQEPLGTRVCVKTLHTGAHADPAFATRFEREARTTSRLRHPNIVSVFDFGTEPDGTMFLAMEYVEGTPLSRIAPRGRTLRAARAVHLLAQVCDALAFAHQQGVVHRDLKPANIMVIQLPDGTEHVKVLDFGSALMLEGGEEAERLTRVGTVIGTPAYMAPEYILGHGVDGRVDVYAVGVLLYALLTGAPPFRGDTQSVFAQQVSVAPEPPRKRNPKADCSEALERVVLRALLKDPARRFGSALELKDAMLRALAGDTTAAGDYIESSHGMVEVARHERPVAVLSVQAAGRVGRDDVERIRHLVSAHGGQRAPRAASRSRQAEMRFAFGLDREMPEVIPEVVRCALHLADLGGGTLLRLGIHDALASCQGRFAEPGFDWRPFGKGWSRATALATHASAGTPLISGPATRFVPTTFTLTPQRPPPGFDAPVFSLEDPALHRHATGFSLPFVGREEERRALLAFAVEARKGKTRLLRGPSGSGKSALVEAVTLPARNLEVHWQLLRAAPRSLLEPDHLLGRLAALGWTHPEEGGSTTERFAVDLMLGRLDRLADDLSGERRQLRLLSAAIDGVVRRARHGPLVLVFDDLQYADAWTWRALARLVSAAPTLGVSMLLCCRDDQRIPISLPNDAAADDLTPLPSRDLYPVLRRDVSLQRLPEEQVRTAVLKSCGNPRLIEERLRELLQGHEDPFLASPDPDASLPAAQEQLRALLRRRIERLSPTSRRVLGATAVLGGAPRPAHVRAMVDLESAPFTTALGELSEAHLLRSPSRHRLECPYDEVGEAARASIPPERRARWHARAAELLEASEEAPWRTFDVGHHWLMAGAFRKAVDALRRAAVQANEDGDLPQATEALELALRAASHLPETPARDEERATLARDHAAMALRTGHLEEAERSARLAFPWARAAGRLDLAADLLRIHGKVLALQGKTEQGTQEMLKSLDFAQRQGHATVVADACGDLAEEAERRGELDRATELLRRGLEMARRAEGPEAQRACIPLYNRLGRIQVRNADLAGAAASFTQALSLAEESRDRYQAAGLLGNLGAVFAQRGETEKALRFMERALRAAEAIGDPIGTARQSFNLGMLRLQLGQTEEARRLLHTSREAARRAGWQEGLALSEAATARLEAQRQEPR